MFGDLLHQVKYNKTKPMLIDQEITGSDQFRNGAKSKLLSPQKQTQKMLAIAIGWIVAPIMRKFRYTLGGVDLKNFFDGPTGDEITQAISIHLGNEYYERFFQRKKSKSRYNT